MTPTNLQSKRVLVVGLGLTGSSVIRYLHRHNVAFDVVDEKAEPSADLAACLERAVFHKQLNVQLCCDYDVIVLSPGVPRALPAIQAALQSNVDVIGDIELFSHATLNAPVIAVTGSNGKSTVVSWVAHVLNACGVNAVACGNIGVPALDSIDDAVQMYVLELSSYQLESTQSLSSLSAAVINVSDDHLDRYDSIEHYAQVKRRVYRGCSHAVINNDDPRTWLVDQELPKADNMINSSASFSVVDTESSDYRLSSAANDAQICKGDMSLLSRSALQTPGLHNAANALTVLALLQPVQLDIKQVAAALTGFRGLQHRTELVRTRNNVRWYNDSKGTNIDACEKAITAMQGPVVLIAGGQGKDADFAALRSVIGQHVKAVVLIGQDAQIIADALAGITEIHFASDLQDAVNQCAELAVSGDVVLLSPACASFDMFKNFEQRGELFTQAVEALAA
jgi:UDP-N-acetylmuramoylalanine--D-glutamate ligase